VEEQDLLGAYLDDSGRRKAAGQEARPEDERRLYLNIARFSAFGALCIFVMYLAMFGAMVNAVLRMLGEPFPMVQATGMGVVLDCVAYCLVLALYWTPVALAAYAGRLLCKGIAGLISAVQANFQALGNMRK
jgi:hypothetical protein